MPATNLVTFLHLLRGVVVEIELKDGSVVEGEISSVDPNMNTHLRSVKIVAKGKPKITVPQLTVRGGTIRFYKLPDTIDFDKQLARANQSGSGKPAAITAESS
jgi:small nuclear ribonucleoprotein D1